VLHELLIRGIPISVSVIETQPRFDQNRRLNIIDLGPKGGTVAVRWVAPLVTPEQVAEVEGSYTGIYLKQMLGPQRKGLRPESSACRGRSQYEKMPRSFTAAFLKWVYLMILGFRFKSPRGKADQREKRQLVRGSTAVRI